MHEVTDRAGATRLAALLNGTSRRRPVVVVTTPAGHSRPFIDVGLLETEVGDVAEIYLIGGGDHTWTFSRLMPDRTQVYGGAGRSYPVGHAWVNDLRRSPLRFAFDADEGRAATHDLATDALAMAAEAGLFERTSTAATVVASGEVKGVTHAERALVRLDNGTLATVIPELAVPGEPLERVLAAGMRVSGPLDPTTHRLDVRSSVTPAAVALESYPVCGVVLARVVHVDAQHATLRLHPNVDVVVPRADVTSNDLDDLRSLMTVGEVLTARLLTGAPDWQLGLLDVDDDEMPVAACSLLREGPPWLLPPDDDILESESVVARPAWVEPAAASVSATPEDLADVRPGSVPPPSPAPAPRTTARPDPRRLDHRFKDRPSAPVPDTPAAHDGGAWTARPPLPRPPVPGPPGTPTSPGTQVTTGPTAGRPLEPVEPRRVAVATLNLTVAGLKAQLEAALDDVATLTNERNELRRHLEESEADLARSEADLLRQRAALRKSRQRPTRASPGDPAPEFADPEVGFRYAVLGAWARRTPLGEQRADPLPPYDIGPAFLASLQYVAGVSPEKIADVVFEIVTGRADSLIGREVHQLRSGPAGTPYVRRADDNATCWRASLQVGTAQARRLHYWRKGGRVELSRVVLHDDFNP